MSAKGRSETICGQHELAITPAWAVRAIMEVEDVSDAINACAYDLGAGLGDIGHTLLECGLSYVNSVELHVPVSPVSYFHPARTRKYLRTRHIEPLRLYRQDAESFIWSTGGTTPVVMNPPFSQATRWLNACWALNKSRPVLVYQRLGWWWPRRTGEHSQITNLIGRGVEPYIHALSQRPTHVHGHGSDACEYAWHWFPEGIYTRARRGMQFLRRPTKDEVTAHRERLAEVHAWAGWSAEVSRLGHRLAEVSR